MREEIRVLILGLAVCAGSAATAWAHASVKPKSVDPLYDGRSYKEGTTAYISLVPSHGCRDDSGQGHSTKSVYVLFPNTEDLSDVAFTQGRGETYAGNAIMAIKPELDARFYRVQRVRGAVPEFYSHGAKAEDVRSLRWRGGDLPDDMYAELKFRAALPVLAGCVERLRVYMPTVQYCSGGLKNVWVREATEAFPEDVISAGYAPYFDVVRDYDQNPLPDTCEQVVSAEAYPSAADIDHYLVRSTRRFWRR